MVRFFRSELWQIGLSVLVLSVAMANFDPRRFALVSLPLVVGFMAHELAHKYAAMRYGYFSIYRMWPLGLGLALLAGLASRGTILVAAPGAVVILTGYFTPREGGTIGLSGPLTNLGLACIFGSMYFFEGIIGSIGFYGAFINLWLAFFNLLPVPPLDGDKVFRWSPKIWVAVEIPLLILVFMLFR